MITWTDDQRRLRDGLAPLLDKLSAGHVERDAEAAFPREQWDLLRASGILGLPFEERWGGLGQDLLTTMYVLEGLGLGCRDAGLNFSVCSHLVSTGVPLHRFGSPELKERYLPGLCSGDLIGAHAISEPDSGSDALAMRTRAVRDGDDYVLTGGKTFVSNGPVADVVTVYARTSDRPGPLSITAFLVDRDTPGLTVGRPVAKMGLRTSPLCELYFDGCRVPASRVVGRPGGGFLVLDHVMRWEILCSFVINAGEMRHRVERCAEYARTRTQFGQPIGSYQAISHKIVDMEIGVETARHWLYSTARKVMAGENVTRDIAVAKLVTSEANVASALAAVQIFGGNGYMAEYGIEKELRNSVAGTIYSGTSEIQRNRIASMLGL
ncbi:acyl-CoA dehydrogenase [Streptomyces sp. WAC05374]|uniref:acyl-CoA dehydrogenase family protein n=1 Tax=Streptomyces sp. WAC05374 TaxID=2487420 RepID=UPI000F865365|nr:acyl-CoA dehydrogenase family protein [Streptomyces sp. WAC05374]RST16651.1 acyl-CoA dehydrogenase [Streptomyces sp. WAC05374]TDF35978.1 acyl-CoA dehydrogenase [Streptomyces sp. WAC05374]TDF44541.1 acyl-CoA dehydrogenase [Streptomyces sp. WAC05374]TDF45671.1 acyl-CoA dehydrogenase [Streptomyces sp. WAC05374]